MSTGTTLLANVRLADGRDAELRMSEGVIDTIGPSLDAAGTTVIDGGGLLALPGMIDGKDRQNSPPICVVGGVAVWSRKCGYCQVRCRCERRRFAVEVTRFGGAGHDGSVSGRREAGGQEVRRSVAAARRWAQSGEGQ